MQQQSGSHHSVSPEYIYSASDDSRSCYSLNSWWCWFGTHFDPEVEVLVVRILGSNQCYRPNRRAKQRPSRTNSEKGCNAPTAAVHFENTKWLDGGDELSIRPVETNTQVSIFMPQQSESHHYVSPEYILSASDDSRSRYPLTSWWCAGSELVLIQRSRFWLSGYWGAISAIGQTDAPSKDQHRIQKGACNAPTAAVHFGITKLLDGGDELSIRPVETNT